MKKGDWDTRPPSYISKHAKRIVTKFVDPLSRILDIGCGRGDFLEKMRGWNIGGCDITRYTDNEPFFICDLNKSIDQPDGSYDVVTAWNVIEHLENPWQAVQEVKRILKPNGHFLFSLPNVFNLRNRLRFLLRGEFSRYNHANDHKAIFTKKTLRDLTEGFECVEQGYIGTDGFPWLSDELRGHTLYRVERKG